MIDKHYFGTSITAVNIAAKIITAYQQKIGPSDCKLTGKIQPIDSQK